MGIDRFNSEGYFDPTTYEALTKVEREERAAHKAASFRPLVYICSPFSGDIEKNVYKTRLYCRFAVAKNAIPLAPHLLFPQFMDENTERSLALFMDMVVLGKCSEVWVFGNIISEGMAFEIEKAKRQRKVIRYFTEDLDEKNLAFKEGM